MPNGVDVSEHDANRQGHPWQPDQFAQYDFAIIRAFNEWANPDRYVTQHWRNADGQTLRGIYGWPVPGRDNWALGAQLVELFPAAEAGYWADREISGAGQASADEVGAYLKGIEDAGGKAGFYSNIGECPRSPYLDAHDWWMADYGPNNGQRHDPYQEPPVPARPYTIHQYSSAGALDRNYSETLDWATGDDVPLSDDDINRVTLPLIQWMQNNVTGQNLDGSNTTNRNVLDPVLALKVGAGGLTEDEVRKIVRDELDRTKLGT